MTSEAEYIAGHSSASDSVLDAIERWAGLHTAQPQMICGPQEGCLLTMMSRALNAAHVVEIGTFVAYSTICIARGMQQGGVLHTFEVNEEYEVPIRRHLKMAGVEEKVRLHIGDALKLLPEHLSKEKNPIDMVFIDADKRSLEEYYEMVVPHVRRGGLVLIDNVLWGNKVLDMERYHDKDTMLINGFNEKVAKDERVDNVLIGVRDGLMVCSVL